MVELLNDKLKKGLRGNYNQFIMRMMEQRDILNVLDWTEAFSRVGNAAVRKYKSFPLVPIKPEFLELRW